MPKTDLPPEFLDALRRVTGKRARIVVDHILEHGYITTEDLQERYGYNHPPRAARDVREQGIPLETFRVAGRDGRQITAYRFGDLAQIEHGKLGGRRTIPKHIKTSLLEVADNRCAICQEHYPATHLQVDHQVPYEIVGDVVDVAQAEAAYMLVCGSCNRAKSWTCEHCENWTTQKASAVCQTCYWASPVAYDHIAMQSIRRLDVVWSGAEVAEFEKLKRQAERDQHSLQAYIKAILARHLVHQDHPETPDDS